MLSSSGKQEQHSRVTAKLHCKHLLLYSSLSLVPLGPGDASSCHWAAVRLRLLLSNAFRSYGISGGHLEMYDLVVGCLFFVAAQAKMFLDH